VIDGGKKFDKWFLGYDVLALNFGCKMLLGKRKTRVQN